MAGADDAIISKTLEGIITSWNPGAEALFGYSAEEAVGQSIALIIPPDRLHEEDQISRRVRRGEKTEHFETERRHKGGRLVPVSVNVSPIHDLAGVVIGASKIARDITEARLAQERLRHSFRRLEALYRLADRVGRATTHRDVWEAALDAITKAFDAARASVLLFDSGGSMRFVAWRGLSDRYRQAVDGHSPWARDCASPQDILVEDVLTDPSLGPLRDEIAREGIRSLAFFPLLDQDRLLGKVMVYFDHPRRFTPDELLLARTISRHVSFGLAQLDAETEVAEALGRERAARSEADLARGDAERANRTKDEFLAMLAHELRNPLGIIVNAGAILERHSGLPPELGGTVSMIDRQAKHLARLLDDLLDVARITSGHIDVDRLPIDLQAVVSLGVENLRLQTEAKLQHVSVSLPSEPVTVIGDGVRLQQVVGNLVSNASKYTPPEGRIWVTLELDAGEAAIRVRDNGAGIARDSLDAIFDLFVQANATLARTEGGLGIGLTLVRRVVELHGGSVAGHSEGAGKGAEFTVRLPLAAATSIPEPAPGPTLAGPGKRVLVVEDHPDGREALAMLLRSLGHEVFEAASGVEGVAMARDRQPDVALVDIGLPDLNGYDVGEALRQMLGTRVRLVAISGYGQPTDRERAVRAGFDAHFVKPMDAAALQEALTARPT